MTKEEIKHFLESHQLNRERTIVIIDYGNVEKWKDGLGWEVGIRELANLVKNLTTGAQFLRRFYYGSDFGKSERSTIMVPWSEKLIETVRNNKLDLVTKRVKYIHEPNSAGGFIKKCDLDVEMAIDLVKERENYDNIVLFSGDGDLAYALRYLRNVYDKICYVFSARGRIGKEIIDAKNEGIITDIFYAEDFEYRLNRFRFR